MSKMLIINTLFIVYCIGLVVALTSVNNNLKTVVNNRYIHGGSLHVKDGTGYQSGADQWFAQRGLNHDNNKLVQSSEHNRWSRYQWTRNNYQQPVQKTSQMYQYQLTNVELVR